MSVSSHLGDERLVVGQLPEWLPRIGRFFELCANYRKVSKLLDLRDGVARHEHVHFMSLEPKIVNGIVPKLTLTLRRSTQGDHATQLPLVQGVRRLTSNYFEAVVKLTFNRYARSFEYYVLGQATAPLSCMGLTTPTRSFCTSPLVAGENISSSAPAMALTSSTSCFAISARNRVSKSGLFGLRRSSVAAATFRGTPFIGDSSTFRLIQAVKLVGGALVPRAGAIVRCVKCLLPSYSCTDIASSTLTRCEPCAIS